MIQGKVIELCSTYNHGHFLAAMIDAAFTAERPPDWLMVVDDGSTDNSREVLERKRAEYPRLLVRYNAANRGALRNVEDMIAEVDCDYLVLRSADDRDGRQLIFHGVQHLDAHPEAAFFGTDVSYCVASTGPLVAEPAGLPGGARFVAPDRFTEDFGGNMIHGAGIVFRTSAVRAVGGFPPQYAWHSDWFVLMSLAFTHGFVYEPIIGSEVFLDSGSYNSTGTRDLARAHAVYAAMVQTLAADPAHRLFAQFRKHAVFDLMGERFREFITAYENGLHTTLLECWNAPAIQHQRRQIGIHAVVRNALRAAAESIRAASVFCIYGAGLHTGIVLNELTECGLRAPDAIIVTNPAGMEPLNGIPVIGLEKLTETEGLLVLISSKSYEREMLVTATEKLPLARLVTVWGQY